MPREVFKFELADAKIPEFHPQFQHERYQIQPTNGHRQRHRQRKSKKQPDQTSITANIDENSTKNLVIKQQQTGDQSGADSRLLHIAHPASVPTFELQRQRGMKPLPFSVAKAISQALKQDFNIPLLDTIKYYFKDPVPKTTKLTSLTPLPPGAKLVSDSQIKQWWQRPPFAKTSSLSLSSGSTNLLKIGSTTAKPGHFSDTTSSSLLTNEYVAYPLLRSYPVQYSLNVASDLVNGVGFLYGDRIYAKPYTYQKNINQVNSLRSDIKPVVEPKPIEDDDNITGVFHTTQNSISSTSPVLFPTSTSETPKSHTFVKYYSAEMLDDNGAGIPLSTDKNTLNLINKAVSELKKHNPHLDVIPKRIEKNELIVHVTPKPDYFTKSTTANSLTTINSGNFKDFHADKNLVYLNKIIEPSKSNEKPINGKTTQHSAYVTRLGVPADLEQLVRFSYHHILLSSYHISKHNIRSQLEQGYAFGYRVRDYNTGTDFGHTQKRMTDGTTMGEYKILMPDGRMQNVKYKADDNGYHADVSYDV